LVNAVFVCSIFALLALSQIDKSNYMNPKNRAVMQSLTEGIKFVFNNKTVLGAITLDMVAVLWWSYSTLTHLAQDILKVGPEGFGF
jgi:hypothetical protein